MSFGFSYSKQKFWQQCWCMHRQPMAFPLCMCSGFPTERVEQTIEMSLDDVTVITHAIGGRKYIRRTHLGFGAVIWVSGTKCLGQSSHPSSTLAILVPLVEQELTQDELFSLFMYVHAPRLFGSILVSMTLVV